jgi:DNA (cytosine-5)-methyltransferase 1
MNKLTLGSLFDGSGGFPLGGLLCGIEPLWASEIEPFPIRVTTKRLPQVKHYGDISEMDGRKIEPVDIITFGSPCQDMSIAGKRSGLDGNRSALFYEAVRIIKEMRCATGGKYPRWICWENVPGAFSSNKCEDFRAVLDTICKIKDETCDVPRCKKWECAGEILGDGFSVAWRVLDAQFWGVPQRRKRIFLIADFSGGSAGQILFESEGLSGYSAESLRAWQRTAGCAENGIRETSASSLILNDQGGARMDITENVTCTLRAEAHHPPCVMESAGFCTEHSAKARSIGFEEELSPTLRAGVVPAALALENHPTDSRIKISDDNKIQTLTSRMGTGGNNVPLLMKIRCGCEGGGKGFLLQKDKSATLSRNNDQTLFEPKTWDGGNQRMPDKDNINRIVEAYGICSKESNSMKSDNPHSGFYKADTSRTIDRSGGNPACNQGGLAVVEGLPFTQNQRNEVRMLGDKSGALCKSATKQQTYVLQGSMIGRKDENGPQGDGVNENISFTLNSVDKHAVVFAIDRESFNCGQKYAKNLGITEDGISSTLNAQGPSAVATPTYSSSKASFFTAAEEELANTLVATDYKDPPLINDIAGTQYAVRRLIPTECAALQGFPTRWCADLGTESPTYGEIAFWRDVFETHRKITGKYSKPKTEKQIIAWLKNPHSDSAEYSMWGNGVALPCVCFVLAGIVYYTQKEAPNIV